MPGDFFVKKPRKVSILQLQDFRTLVTVQAKREKRA
jgi:hypothetical protein